ncbi:MAG: MATE family efflux transporter [Clostridiales bacterium]|nr:MATE family efflux transporter [Clostridiales bacterium]MDY2729422.1 MATE family efflux transporter [Clostridium sp.]
MKEKDLTKGKVIKVILYLALPIMGSSFLQFTYNLIDMLWVGMLGSSAVASVGSSSLYINIGYAINSLVVIGTGVKVAHAIGKKNNKEISEYINSGILINLSIGIVFGIVLIAFGKHFIDFLNLNDVETSNNAYKYLVLNAPMLFFYFYNLLYTRIMGSFGNNKTAFKINSVGVIINILLDPILIYIFKFGVVGAAIATLIANIITFILFRINAGETFKYNLKIKVNYIKIKEIIKLGLPMAFQRVLFTLINILLAKIIATFGANAIAAQKIGVQIESVAYMVIGGFNGAVAAFTGQNFGAKKYERIKAGYKSSLMVGAAYALAVAGLFLAFNKQMVSLFVKEEETIKIAAAYLKVVAFTQIFSATEMISNGLFTGIGKPNIPATISIVFTTLRIPLALFLTKFFGVDGVWISIAISSALKGIFAYGIYTFIYNKKY